MQKKYKIAYYCEGDDNPIADFMNMLNEEQRGRVMKYSDLLEEKGFDLKEPYVKKLKGFTDLWELRPHFWNTEIRIIFTWYKNNPLYLDGFIKKGEGKKTKRHYIKADKRRKKLLEVE